MMPFSIPTRPSINRHRPHRKRGNGVLLAGLAILIALAACLPVKAQQDPLKVELSPLVKRLLDDDLLSKEQRREIKIFHGQWDGFEDLSPRESLQLAVLQYRVDEKTIEALDRAIAAQPEGKFGEPDLHLLAKAAYLAGRPQEAIELFGDMDVQFTGPEKLRIARVCEDLGQYEQAIGLLKSIREIAQKDIDALKTAEDLTAAAQAVVMLARLEGRPAADFHLANQLLSKAHEEVDPLYWPAYLAEAELLWSKGNPRQALEAAGQALSLNPKSSEAWYLIGSMRTRFFDFESGSKAVSQLHKINAEHPLADALAVQIALRQKDVATAREAIGPALKRYPKHRKLLALSAAIDALAYDDKAKQAGLAAFETLAPDNPQAQFEVGQTYADARQYALAEPHLKEAIKRMPGWAEPQLALGELYMQWGKLDAAAAQLQTASSLDPFHKAITNQLLLSQEMLSYETIETDQIIVRYLPGIDEVLARDVALHMGEMAEAFIKRFGHDPPALTQVDLMPDDQHFAVRITGMPDIWTIAACTGDVIAMTPPRPGPKRAYGVYNWLNVMGHEYAHVVNLSQTNNRVPHWFTEGCAVQMETTGRLWTQYTLLARCYNTDKLFKYDEINWGFIRPTEDYHRSLAYAQSAWIMQYIEETHGWDKALAMLNHYNDGLGEHETIRKVFGKEPDAFMKDFLTWAGTQVKAWGMSTYGKTPADPTLVKLLTAEDPAQVDVVALETAVKQYPDEPGLLKLAAQVYLAKGDLDAATQWIKRYQSARPVDPWSDRELARLALSSGDSETAIAAMLALDKIEGDAPEYAVELSRVYRGRKDLDKALHFAERALLREPYNAIFREAAATIAVQKKDMERAAFHVESLELLEPERSIHPRRLAVIYKRLGKNELAEAAKERGAKLKLLETND